MASNSKSFVVLDESDDETDYFDDEGRRPNTTMRIQSWMKRNLSREGASRAFKNAYYINGSPLHNEIKKNLKSGITVSLVSVPLSISLAIAGGATPVMGVVTAFWSGLVAALLGGSHYNVVGPTGALSGVLAASSEKYGVGVLPILAIVTGILCFLVWVFKFDKYVMFIPSSVIHGFTVGVAFIIGLNQLNAILGLSGLPKHEIFVENVWESLYNVPHANPWSVAFFAINLTSLLLLVKKWPKIPWAIVISMFGILVGYLTTKNYIPIHLKTLETSYGAMNDLSIVTVPKFTSKMVSFDVITSSIGVAFIAILETLISARIADGMTKTEHNQRKEVISIGIANALSGIMGGIPATAALARTALNIKAGATSRVSGIINAFSVLVISLLLLPLFKFIPMSTIGALLVMTSIRMVAHEHLIHMFHYDRKMFFISLLSAISCVAIDTMAGILIGGIVSLLIFTEQMSIGHTEIQLNKGKKPISYVDISDVDKGPKKRNNAMKKVTSSASLVVQELPQSPPQTEEFGDTLVYRVTGQLTYVNSLAHVKRVKKIAKTQKELKNIVLALRYLWYADLDGVDALEEIVQYLETYNIKVYFSGVVHETVINALERHPFYQKKMVDNMVFPSYLDALTYIEQSKDNGNAITSNVNSSPGEYSESIIDKEEMHYTSTPDPKLKFKEFSKSELSV